MTREERQLREAIIAKCRWMNASGLNQGTSGNISARYKDRMLITPSATPYDAMKPEMIASMPLEGEYGSWEGPLQPSTEWRFHLDIMRGRPDVGGIVHTHSTYATVLAIARKPIPGLPLHDGGIRRHRHPLRRLCALRHQELSDLALQALEGRNGCLLANHGMIALGANLDKAMWLAVELETIARQYYLSLALGSPHHSERREIADTAKGFSTYGLQAPKPSQRTPASKPARREREAPARHREEAQQKAMTGAAPVAGRDHGLVDIAVIGGGINGAGIARDAAGRGLKVLLCEKDDFAEGTSSRSGKLVHGGLRYLEYYEFRLVREALIEREVLLASAPHIIWPMRFVLPHSPEQRPAWLVRTGLFLYDHLGGRKQLPPSRGLDLAQAPEGAPLRAEFRRGFEYSDCWVDDARLVILNLIDAAQRGARSCRARARCARAGTATSGGSRCRATTATAQVVRARALVNAAGPWVQDVVQGVAGLNSAHSVRLVKGSHIVVPKFWSGPQAYLLQNTDRRVIFVNPYEDDLALIGTTDIPYRGRAEDVAIDEGEIDYLLSVLRRYFRTPPQRERHRARLLRRAAALRRQRRQPVGGDARLCLRGSTARRIRRRCCRSSAARSRPIAGSPSRRWSASRRGFQRCRRPGPRAQPLPGGDIGSIASMDFVRIACARLSRSAAEADPSLCAPLRHACA